MTSLAGQKITTEQQLYISEHLAKLKGMTHELIAKKSFLQKRLQNATPKTINLIQRELGSLEGQIDAVSMNVEFIENWPGTCMGFCNKGFDKCSYGPICPHHQVGETNET